MNEKRKLMIQWRMVVRILIWAGVLILGIGLWIFFRTPQFTMAQIIEAYEDNDWELFERYVDLKDVSNSLVDQYLTALAASGSRASLETARGRKMQLVAAVQEQVREFVITGRYKPDPETRMIFPDLKTLRNRFQGIDYIRSSGQLANIGLKASDGSGTIIFKLRRKSWHWQVFAVDLADYFKKTIGENSPE